MRRSSPRRFVEFLEQGYVYKGLKPVNWCIRDRTALAEAEIEYENAFQPVHLGAVCAHLRSGGDRSALADKRVYGLIWTTTPWTIPANLAIAFHPKYIYVAVDVAGDVYIVAKDLLAATAEACGWESPRETCRICGRTTEPHGLPPSFSRARFGGHPGRSRDAGAGNRRGPHRSWPRPGGLRRRPGQRPPDILSGGRRRALLSCRRRAGALPEELIGKRCGTPTPIVIELLKDARSAAGLRARSITAIRTAGAATTRPSSAPRSSGSSAWIATIFAQRALEAIKTREVEAGMGRGAHLQHDRHAAGLVHFAPARLGRAHHRVLLRSAAMRPLTDRKVLDRVVELFRKHTADAWYSMTAEELMGPGRGVRQMRRDRLSARKTTFWTSGSIRASAIWPC